MLLLFVLFVFCCLFFIVVFLFLFFFSVMNFPSFSTKTYIMGIYKQ